AGELQAHRGAALDTRVGAEQGREADRAVLERVLLGSDAQVGGVEYAEGRREHPLARQPVASQIDRDAAPSGGQRFGEGEGPIELEPIALLAPLRMVEVLRAPCRVDTGRLDVAVGI